MNLTEITVEIRRIADALDALVTHRHRSRRPAPPRPIDPHAEVLRWLWARTDALGTRVLARDLREAYERETGAPIRSARFGRAVAASGLYALTHGHGGRYYERAATPRQYSETLSTVEISPAEEESPAP